MTRKARQGTVFKIQPEFGGILEKLRNKNCKLRRLVNFLYVFVKADFSGDQKDTCIN